MLLSAYIHQMGYMTQAKMILIGTVQVAMIQISNNT